MLLRRVDVLPAENYTTVSVVFRLLEFVCRKAVWIRSFNRITMQLHSVVGFTDLSCRARLFQGTAAAWYHDSWVILRRPGLPQ